jgi:hypothetical protein
MTDWPGVDRSPDGRWLASTVSQGGAKSEVYVVDLRAGGAPIAVAAGEPEKFSVVEMLDDRLLLFTTKAAVSYLDFRYAASDILLFGRETVGVTDEVAAAADARLKIPMKPALRSLNVATAAAMVVGEALRQTREEVT